MKEKKEQRLWDLCVSFPWGLLLQSEAPLPSQHPYPHSQNCRLRLTKASSAARASSSTKRLRKSIMFYFIFSSWFHLRSGTRPAKRGEARNMFLRQKTKFVNWKESDQPPSPAGQCESRSKNNWALLLMSLPPNQPGWEGTLQINERKQFRKASFIWSQQARRFYGMAFAKKNGQDVYWALIVYARSKQSLQGPGNEHPILIPNFFNHFWWTLCYDDPASLISVIN